ncbi:MAG: hypothetical protein WAW86_05555 [Gammaproteobacteria bacterium]
MCQGYGHTQIDLSVDAYTSPGEWFSKEPHLKDLIKHTLLVYLMPEKTGLIADIQMNGIEELSSVRKIDLVRNVGEYVRKAQHLDDMLGVAWLQNEDINVLWSDKVQLESKFKVEYELSPL